MNIIDTETGLIYELAEGVNTEKIDPLAYYLIMLVGKIISDTTKKTPVFTSGWRSAAGQLAAMQHMEETQPELYKDVYGPMLRRGQDPATMPHCQGRAGDWLFAGFELAESKLLEINGWLMEGIAGIIGYKPSRFIYPEKGKDKDGKMKVRCYHCQLPTSVPDKVKMRDYLAATFART